MTGYPDEKTAASSAIVTFKPIKGTQRICGVGVIDDLGSLFFPRV